MSDPLRIEVEELDPGGERRSGSQRLDFDGRTDDDLAFGQPVAYDLWVILDGEELHVRGSVATSAEGSCDRCLVDRTLTLQRDFELVYEPVDVVVDEADPIDETELDEEDLAVDHYDGSVLDLRRVLVEQILLCVPMKVLCSDDCRGLCPQCGIDRNRESCDCVAPADPRLAGLAELRDQL